MVMRPCLSARTHYGIFAMMRSASSKLAIAAILALGGAAAGCSSSGGAGPAVITQSASPTQPSPPPPTPPVSFDTAEYRNQPGLEQINALPAYDVGADGAGIVVAIIDTGIDVNNPEFKGRIHAQSADLVVSGVVANSEIRNGGPTLQDSDDHGTAVASIIGAARDGVGVHGVAPEAQLLIFRTDDNTSSETLLGDAIVEGITRAANLGADVLNFSFGSDAPTARADYAAIFDFTKQNDIVVVASAGNDGDADPDQTALGAVDVPDASATIIAGAAKANGEITIFSNRAGAAADIFLLAPGEFIHTTFAGANPGETQFFSGSSAATPHIAGAAALIRELWPQLDATEVVDVLLDSATDLGAPGTDPIYGRGLLNIGAAVAPLGTVTTTSVKGVVSDVSQLDVELSPAFGAGFSSLTPIVVLDDFGRDFRTDLNGALRAAAPDRFDIETAFDPFREQVYANRRINNQMTAAMRLTSRDHSLAEFLLSQPAAFSGSKAPGKFVEDSFDIALTSDIGAGRSLTIAQGFTAPAVDRMGVEMRQTPFFTPGIFEDAYLPQASGAITAVLRAPVAKRVTIDFLASFADEFQVEDLVPVSDQTQRHKQQIATMRAGFNLDLKRLRLRIEQGLRQESGAVLNASFGGNTSASTLYAAADADLTLSSRWRVKARYAAGYSISSTDGFGGLIDGFSNLTSSQFSLSVIRQGLFNRADRMWLGVSQPLQIESGSLRMTLPTGFDQLTETLSYSTIAAPLTSNSGRLDFEAGYRLYMGRLGSIDVNVIHQSFAPAEIKATTALILHSGFRF